MSDTTRHLSLPYLMPAQAQKHVTHNEALQMLDGLVQLSVRERSRSAPPDAPADGDRYIVGAGASGDWTGWDGDVACFLDGGWMRLAPRTGWRAWVEDEGRLVIFDGSVWAGTTATEQQNLSLLGLGTEADAANPFAAKLNAALWTARPAAEGGDGDLRYTLNKETAAHVLSLLFQSGYSARAEVGLLGSDDLTLKVSPDGETWFDAVRIDQTTGKLQLIGVDAGDLSAETVQGASCSVGKLTVGANPDETADDVALSGNAALSAGNALRLVAGRDGEGQVEILRGRGNGTGGSEGLLALARFDGDLAHGHSVVTRDLGDARFLGLAGGTLTGTLTLRRPSSGFPLVLGDDGPVSLRVWQSAGEIHVIPYPQGQPDWAAALSYNPADRKWHIGGATNPTTTLLRQADGDIRYLRSGTGSVGNVAVMRNESGGHAGPGSALSASQLRYASLGAATVHVDTVQPYGTWRALSGCAANAAGLFERIA